MSLFSGRDHHAMLRKMQGSGGHIPAKLWHPRHHILVSVYGHIHNEAGMVAKTSRLST